MQQLDLFAAPLAGLTLIEASAGTGKTYTLTGLYLRLVLEAGRRVDRILVVTYTKAATEELRDRIGRRLVEARAAFIEGGSEDSFYQQLLERHWDHREQAVRRLTNAVRGFDEAAIFTIHGFCQRMLAEGAFESGMPFETELLPDVRELLQEIVDDFWRREFHTASPFLINYLLDRGHSPETLLKDVHSYAGKTYLKVQGPAAVTGSSPAETAFAQAYVQVRTLWQRARQEVEALLGNATGLDARKYAKTAIPGWIALLDDYLAPQTPSLRLFDKFEKFTARSLAAAVKKNQVPPEHAFFQVCDTLACAYKELEGCYQRYCRALKVRLLEFCNSELVHRKQRKQVQSYDDLLGNLHQALTGAQGAVLAKAIRRRYSAALIDEFQDTDPVQYAIFRQVYGNTELPVFLVGDPKQAIYSFRGADIFAYLQARHDAARHYTLDINWRSEPRLIRAVNALFGQACHPFLFEDIPFKLAQSPATTNGPLLIEGESEPPFRFWLLGSEDPAKPLGKGQAHTLAARATAAEIARLLTLGTDGRAWLDGRPLEGGDIAVLVRKHRQGQLVRTELLRLGVPCIQHAQGNVFASWEALELERVLLAVAEPGRETLVRAALVTDMLGMTGEELYRGSEDGSAWEAYLEAFQGYHRLWREHGFIRMFSGLMAKAGIPARLLSFQDGERRLTNLLHLAELLQAQASRRHAGIGGLIKWLGERRRSQAAEDEEQQLRLESDENLVRIVTVHKSKGLEYPVVFCPFLWDGRLYADQADSFAFHDPENDYRPVLDLGSDDQDEWRPLARREELAESLRLLYVALTRAKYQCYMAWGAIQEAGTAAPAWLLHPLPDGIPASLDAVANHVKDLSTERILKDLTKVAERSEGAVRIESPPEEAVRYRPPGGEEPHFQARHFSGAIQGKWRISSFTALAADLGTELPDYDATGHAEEMAGEAEVRSIFTFPRGAQAGRCLHSLFEHLDFTQRDRLLRESLVEKTLAEHGFDSGWTPCITAMVERVLSAPLNEAGVRLSAVTAEQRLNELEFYYPLARLEPEGLRRVLYKHGDHLARPFQEDLQGLAFAPVHGYMKGFIDLVFAAEGRFYLADYKSNWLGAGLNAYRTEPLLAVMARESYYLQYLIYTVALHRYLRLRLPGYDYDAHFGGVFYLFLRGMDPAVPGNGIFQDRPARALVEALDAYIDTGEAV